jgi:hypothetical protein
MGEFRRRQAAAGPGAPLVAEEPLGEGAEFELVEERLDRLVVAGREDRSSQVTATGTSVMMVARSLESSAWSEWVSTSSFCRPLSLAELAMRFSIEPNSAMSFWAVFGPMPGMPGMLSEASPIRPSRSMIWWGSATPQISGSFRGVMISWSCPCGRVST